MVNVSNLQESKCSGDFSDLVLNDFQKFTQVRPGQLGTEEAAFPCLRVHGFLSWIDHILPFYSMLT